MKNAIKKLIKMFLPKSVWQPVYIQYQNWLLAYQMGKAGTNSKFVSSIKELNRNSQKNNRDFSVTYDFGFYVYNRYHSAISALHILPTILRLCNTNSMIDFGCGTGTWLWVAQKLGVKEITGLDGKYVPKSLLMIPESSFNAVDLQKPVSLPWCLK